MGAVDDIRVYDRALTPDEVTSVSSDEKILLFAAIPVNQRSQQQKKRLADYFATIDPITAGLKRRLGELIARPPSKPMALAAVVRAVNTRKTYVHIAGDFQRKGDEVDASTPAFLHPLRARGAQPDRLDLARWIIAAENPLTTRVAVNHVWAHLFGHGIVRTSEDFGHQGEPPSHPDLLDWLAAKFVQMGWSRKALIRLIVTSSTYRQSSKYRRDLVDSDPENRRLSRQNSYRLDAEAIRDQFLLASGLLNRRVGGPSFRPQLPEGIGSVQYSNQWSPNLGPLRHSRSVYIHLQRNLMFPMLMAFDHPDSILPCTRRQQSNTPLQGLTLLNSPLVVECARRLGLTLAEDSFASKADRIRMLFLRCVARSPSSAELARVLRFIDEMQASYETDTKSALTLIGNNPSTVVSPAEAAAWICVSRAVLNLDEVITRE